MIPSALYLFALEIHHRISIDLEDLAGFVTFHDLHCSESFVNTWLHERTFPNKIRPPHFLHKIYLSVCFLKENSTRGIEIDKFTFLKKKIAQDKFILK